MSTPRYAAYHRLPPNARGALWMLASAISFTVMTMLIKFLGDEYPSPLQTFYRQLAGLLVVLPVVLPNPRKVLYTTRPGIMLLRAAAGTARDGSVILRVSEDAAGGCERIRRRTADVAAASAAGHGMAGHCRTGLQGCCSR